MDAHGWPPVSVAAAVLPAIRRELLAQARAARALPGPPIDVCAIVEDGLLGYELAPHAGRLPFLILGCARDGIPRLRHTTFDPASPGALRLAAAHGRTVTSRARGRRAARNAEILYGDWATAAMHAWGVLDPALDFPGTQWDASMAGCRSLENALARASLHLAEWDPAVDFCGLLHQAEYGLPLSAPAGTGTLTLRRSELWHLRWQAGATLVEVEFSYLAQPPPAMDRRPRDARR